MRSKLLNRGFSLCLLASVLTGGALVFAFPCFDRSEIAWAALIPLTLVALRSSPRAGAGWGYVSGAVFFVASLYWLQHVTVPGWIALGLFLGVYFAAWGWFVARLAARFGGMPGGVGENLGFAALAACAWVGLEIVRTHFLTGFPWNFLGVSQYKNLPLIQFTTVTGVYGVSWLVCFVNVCLALTVLRLTHEFRAPREGRRSFRPHFELTASLALVVLVVLVGTRSSVREFARGKKLHQLEIAVVQPNIPQSEKWDERFSNMIYERLDSLTTGAAQTRPDVIVWPEAATPEPLLYDARAIRIITNAAHRSQAYLLLGSMSVQRNDVPGRGDTWHNSAYLMTPDLELLPPYHKQHLVPFGEFVPLERWLPFMKKVTPIPGSIARGRARTLFEIRDFKFALRHASLGVVICFEDVFPDVFRRFVKDGAQVMVNVTNDAWYKESAGAYQHMANSVFRAVENRVSFVRCANTGYSCFIDPTGRIAGTIEGQGDERIFVKGFRTQKVGIRDPAAGLTFYARFGDVFAWGCLSAAVVAIARWPRRPAQAPATTPTPSATPAR